MSEEKPLSNYTEDELEAGLMSCFLNLLREVEITRTIVLAGNYKETDAERFNQRIHHTRRLFKIAKLMEVEIDVMFDRYFDANCDRD